MNLRFRLVPLLLLVGTGLTVRAAEGPGVLPEVELDSSRVFEMATRQPRELERNLAVAFGRLLGNPSRMDIEVEHGKLSERLGGRFERISVRLEDGWLDKLHLKEAHLEARDVSYDLRELLSGRTYIPRSVGSTRIDLTVDEESINEVVAATRGALRVDSPHFELRPGRIVFTGRIRFLFMRNPIRLVGSLDVRDGSRVDFHPARVQVSSIPLPGLLVDALSRRFNPVVDLGRTPFWKSFSASLGSIEIGDGTLRVRTDPAPGEPEAPEIEQDEGIPPVLASIPEATPGEDPGEDEGVARAVVHLTTDPGSL